MKPQASPLSLFLALCLATVPALRAEMREFEDSTGRKLQAEVLGIEGESVKVKLKSGKTTTIPLSKFSEIDKSYLGRWEKENAASQKAKLSAEAEAKRIAEIPAKMEAYCRSQMGVQVGNGECWTLADEAFKACGLKRPGDDMRVWGRLVDWKKEALLPGDIVEYRTAKFSNGNSTGPEHTAVVTKGGKRGMMIAEQNWGGNKTVHEAPFNPKELVSGEMMIYRPQ